ncbi:MAG: DUF2817 domain-containing protein [Myxococcota bacterium]
MDALAAFSDDYVTARTRFRAQARAQGFSLSALPLDSLAADQTPLTIDLARLGATNPRRALVVSSGTHGVEGFYGAAVQLALLDRPDLLQIPDDCAIVLIHAINPFGFDRIRRVNEDNVDVNRNFLLDGQTFSGSPEGYARLDGLLNPPSPPTRFEAFLPRVVAQIARHGMPALKAAVATGQYDFPRGLFYGGAAPTQSQALLRDLLPKLFSETEQVVHLDLHTGTGKWGTYVLAVDMPPTDPRFSTLQALFDADHVEGLDPSGVLYEIRGVLGTWCQAQVPNTTYHAILAEIGTHWVIEVIGALREENRAWHHTGPDDPRRIAAKKRLKEAFCPANEAWRREMIALGLRLVSQGRGVFR